MIAVPVVPAEGTDVRIYTHIQSRVTVLAWASAEIVWANEIASDDSRHLKAANDVERKWSDAHHALSTISTARFPLAILNYWLVQTVVESIITLCKREHLRKQKETGLCKCFLFFPKIQSPTKLIFLFLLLRNIYRRKFA